MTLAFLRSETTEEKRAEQEADERRIRDNERRRRRARERKTIAERLYSGLGVGELRRRLYGSEKRAQQLLRYIEQFREAIRQQSELLLELTAAADRDDSREESSGTAEDE